MEPVVNMCQIAIRIACRTATIAFFEPPRPFIGGTARGSSLPLSGPRLTSPATARPQATRSPLNWRRTLRGSEPANDFETFSDSV